LKESLEDLAELQKSDREKYRGTDRESGPSNQDHGRDAIEA